MHPCMAYWLAFTCMADRSLRSLQHLVLTGCVLILTYSSKLSFSLMIVSLFFFRYMGSSPYPGRVVHWKGSWGTLPGLERIASTALLVMKFLPLVKPIIGASSRPGTAGFNLVLLFEGAQAARFEGHTVSCMSRE